VKAERRVYSSVLGDFGEEGARVEVIRDWHSQAERQDVGVVHHQLREGKWSVGWSLNGSGSEIMGCDKMMANLLNESLCL